jgi:outer membrane protein W
MRRTLIIIGVVVICGALAAPASAGETGWRLRVFGAWMDPDLDETVPAGSPEEIRVTASSDFGFGASLEYQFTERLGFELGAFSASPEIELSADIPGYGHLSLTDSMSTRVITLDFDVHLTPNSQSIDFYLGAGLANMGFGNLHYVDPDGDPLDLGVGNELTWTLKASLDIAFGDSKWAVTGGIRYIDAELEVWNEDDLPGLTATFGFDTITATLGVAYNF